MSETTPPPDAPPARSGPRWPVIFGCGCGCLALLGIGAAVAFFMFFRTMVSKTPLTPTQLVYTGDWRGSDGSTLTIRADGGGDYKGGGTTVTNGSVTINEGQNTLTVGMGPIKKSWRIAQPPSDTPEGAQMTLDSTVFTKGGSPSSTPSTPTTPPSTDDTNSTTIPTVPSESESAVLADMSVTSLRDARLARDFTAFHSQISQLWQQQATPEQLLTTLGGGTLDLSLITGVSPTVQTAEVTPEGRLVIIGYYDTTPQRMAFKVQYIKESEEWKLVGINVQPQDASTPPSTSIGE